MELCTQCNEREAQHKRLGICHRCYQRNRYVPAEHKPESLSYVAAHRRVRARRGPASEHACVTCGKPAEEWAYKGGSEREQTGYIANGSFVKWSPSPDDYMPLCVADHRAYDRAPLNVLDQALLKYGLTREQVREVLGLVISHV